MPFNSADEKLQSPYTLFSLAQRTHKVQYPILLNHFTFEVFHVQNSLNMNYILTTFLYIHFIYTKILCPPNPESLQEQLFAAVLKSAMC